MPSNKGVRLILIGDVVGRGGRKFVQTVLPLIRAKFVPDVVIANGENSAGGLGIIKRTADELFEAGINVLTGGNHIWDKKEALELLKTEKRILKPLNYHASTPGTLDHKNTKAQEAQGTGNPSEILRLDTAF